MYKLSSVFLGLVLGMFMFVPMSWSFAFWWDSGDVPSGVYCEVNDVKMFAQSEEDCSKAGGVVTHTIKTSVEPAKPSQESAPE